MDKKSLLWLVCSAEEKEKLAKIQQRDSEMNKTQHIMMFRCQNPCRRDLSGQKELVRSCILCRDACKKSIHLFFFILTDNMRRKIQASSESISFGRCSKESVHPTSIKPDINFKLSTSSFFMSKPILGQAAYKSPRFIWNSGFCMPVLVKPMQIRSTLCNL